MRDNHDHLLDLTVRIALETSGTVQAALNDLPRIYEAVAALGRADAPTIASPQTVASGPLCPAVPVETSIMPDYLISLEDGTRHKLLKRHLAVRGLTPDQYRAKWRLPADYPMAAPNYAAKRSELAKEMGLGRKRA